MEWARAMGTPGPPPGGQAAVGMLSTVGKRTGVLCQRKEGQALFRASPRVGTPPSGR